MKNSAWYYKLWRKKLNEHPIKEDANISWAEMRSLLDENMPKSDSVNNSKAVKFFGGSGISLLSFILPAAAMIGAISYVAVKHTLKKENIHKHHYHLSAKRLNKNGAENDSLSTDTLVTTLKADSEANHNGNPLAAVAKLDIKQSISGPEKIYTKGVNVTMLPSKESPKQHLDQVNIIAWNKTVKSAAFNSRKSLLKTNMNDQSTTTTGDSIASSKSLILISNESAMQQNNNWSGFPISVNKLQDVATGSTSKSAVKKSDNEGSVKIKKNKLPTNAKIKTVQDNGHPLYNYDLEAALNTNKDGRNIVLGIGGIYALKDKWLLNTGIQMDLNQEVSGFINHKSYNSVKIPLNNSPDSTIGTFQIKDERKITTLTIPVTVEYKASNRISIMGGPRISFSVNQTKHTSKLGTIANYKDTLGYTHSIDSSLLQPNNISKLTFGISGGISIGFHQFNIDGSYVQNITPYKVNTALGSYQLYYRSVRIGLRYKFKKHN